MSHSDMRCSMSISSLLAVNHKEWIADWNLRRHGTITQPMKDESKQSDMSEPRIDRSAFSVFSSFAEADAADKAYWLSRTAAERVSHVEFLRRINYGDRASERLQRVLEIVTRARR